MGRGDGPAAKLCTWDLSNDMAGAEIATVGGDDDGNERELESSGYRFPRDRTTLPIKSGWGLYDMT